MLLANLGSQPESESESVENGHATGLCLYISLFYGH